jgi:hypothetical protein
LISRWTSGRWRSGLDRISDDRVALVVLVTVLVFAVGQLMLNVVALDTWMDEGKYLMKGIWYVAGTVAPYSSADPTFYMPFFFYEVGVAQWLFGLGYLPGRLLMVACAIGCLVLVYALGASIGRSRIAGAAAVTLLVAHPVTTTYFATATPYAVVSLLSLLMILALQRLDVPRPLAFVLAGLIFWALFFTRPNMLPIILIPVGWALLIEPRGKLLNLGLFLLTTVLSSAATVALFGRGLLDVVLDTPGLAEVAIMLGMPAPPTAGILPLTTSPLDPHFSFGDALGFFGTYFLKHYGFVALVTLAAIAIRARRIWIERKLKPIDLILGYFWATTLIHFYFSLSYCVDCITPYTNYFLPVGVLGVAVLVEEADRLRALARPRIAVLGVVLAVAITQQAFPAFPDLLRPKTDGVRPLAEQLAVQLEPKLPEEGRVAILSDKVAAAQAVWLAGGGVEARTLYLPTTFREPRAELVGGARNEVEDLIWEAGFWDAPTLRRAVAEDYSTLLIERKEEHSGPLGATVTMGLPFGDVVRRHYALIGTARVGDLVFELYSRRN